MQLSQYQKEGSAYDVAASYAKRAQVLGLLPSFSALPLPLQVSASGPCWLIRLLAAVIYNWLLPLLPHFAPVGAGLLLRTWPLLVFSRPEWTCDFHL